MLTGVQTYENRKPAFNRVVFVGSPCAPAAPGFGLGSNHRWLGRPHVVKRAGRTYPGHARISLVERGQLARDIGWTSQATHGRCVRWQGATASWEP